MGEALERDDAPRAVEQPEGGRKAAEAVLQEHGAPGGADKGVGRQRARKSLALSRPHLDQEGALPQGGCQGVALHAAGPNQQGLVSSPVKPKGVGCWTRA